MSKSLGTGIDPLDLVREYGADALRFGLMTSGSTHQQDIRFSAERVQQARNFANKVWNIARFILSAGDEDDGSEVSLSPADKWILSRANGVVAGVTEDLERYEFSGAGQQLYDFVWSEFADWYLEIAKIRLYDEADPIGRRTARAILWTRVASRHPAAAPVHAVSHGRDLAGTQSIRHTRGHRARGPGQCASRQCHARRLARGWTARLGGRSST